MSDGQDTKFTENKYKSAYLMLAYEDKAVEHRVSMSEAESIKRYVPLGQ